jgi:hypothetical protein
LEIWRDEKKGRFPVRIGEYPGMAAWTLHRGCGGPVSADAVLPRRRVWDGPIGEERAGTALGGRAERR